MIKIVLAGTRYIRWFIALSTGSRHHPTKYEHALFRAAFLLVVFLLLFVPARIPAEQHMILGLYPALSSTEMYKRFTPLAEHLSKGLGRPVEIHLEGSYDAHVSRIESCLAAVDEF